MSSATGTGLHATATERLSDRPGSTEPTTLRRARSRWRWAVVGVVIDAALLVGLTWWLFPSIWAVSVAVVDIDQSAGPEIGVNLREVAKNPDVMWGRTVTISAEVGAVYSPSAVVIGNDAPFVGAEVLIVGATPLDSLLTNPGRGPLTLGDVVRVTGRVHRFDLPKLERDLALNLAVPPGEYDGTSVIVVEMIELEPPQHGGPGDKEFPAGSSGYEIGITVNDIVARPDQYVGEVVEVSDEIDEPALTPHAFVLGDEQLLVVSAVLTPDVFIEATAYVTGEVRLFDLAVMESELGIDLDDAILASFVGEPVLIARAVSVVA